MDSKQKSQIEGIIMNLSPTIKEHDLYVNKLNNLPLKYIVQ